MGAATSCSTLVVTAGTLALVGYGLVDLPARPPDPEAVAATLYREFSEHSAEHSDSFRHWMRWLRADAVRERLVDGWEYRVFVWGGREPPPAESPCPDPTRMTLSVDAHGTFMWGPQEDEFDLTWIRIDARPWLAATRWLVREGWADLPRVSEPTQLDAVMFSEAKWWR